MTMIKCTECGKDISDKAAACIGCGAPLTNANLAVQTVTSTTSVFTSIGDLNGDGKVDYEDFKIAATKTKNFAVATADEAVKMG